VNLMPPPLSIRPLMTRGLAAAVGAASLLVLAGCAGGPASSATTSFKSIGDVKTAVAPGLRGYPFAASRTTTQDYFGVPVSGDFEWLENAADPVSHSWILAESAYSRRYLEAMPARAALRQRLQALIGSTQNAYSGIVERGGTLFALKTASPFQRPVLVVLRSVDELASERIVFDPNEQAGDRSVAIDFIRPSPDGRRVAIALSTGSPDGDSVRIVDLGAGGQLLPDTLVRVTSAAAGGDLAWSAGGTGLFVTHYPAPGSRPAADAQTGVQVVFHKLGAASTPDRVELGAGLPRLARVRLESAREGRSVLALVENGRGGDVALYLKSADANGEGAWRRLASEQDGVRDAQFGDDDAMWIRSIANAPRGKVLRLPLPETKNVNWNKVATIATPLEGALQRFVVAGGTLYLAEGQTGPSRLRLVDVKTRRSSVVALPPSSGVAALVRIGRNDVVAQVTSYVEPPLWTRVGGGKVRRTALVMTSDANFNDSEVVREFATSRDGTPVPVDILRRKGIRLDGHNPVLLTMGGSAGPGTTPDFDATRRVWLDRGGVVAIATLRGASDSGEAWRIDGLRAKKQNAVDDLMACADMLVKRGYTQPALLAVRARGDGALVAIAATTQRPELLRAVVAANGRYDLLRLDRDPAGEYDAPDLGSVKDRVQFDALAALSPLRAVRDGGQYPAVMLLAGERDGRVNPSHSRKMAARLQQANPNGRPTLLRTDAWSGQPAQAALVDAVEQSADELGFLLHEVVAAQ
jgi:prolyl oligopeptidase